MNSAKENLALLLQRVEDSKTNVRKSALQVLKTVMIQIIGILVMYVPSGSLLYDLTHDFWFRAVPLQTLVGLLKHDVIPLSWETLATLSDRCRDPAVSVKKKALQCVGELLAVSLERKRESLFKHKVNINHFCLG